MRPATETTPRPGKIRVLVVCMWPLGGIRTYLKYNYHYFPKDEFEITILARPTIERQYLEKDMKDEGIDVVWAEPVFGKNMLFAWTLRLLFKKRFDLIHSQGYISAFHVALVNWLFRRPHVLTMHGVLEERYFSGRFMKPKRLALEIALRNVTVFHGVGKDVLDHFHKAFPRLRKGKADWVVISNGIEPEKFLREEPHSGERLRARLQFDTDTFIFGFFGRFMPEKGFEYIISAVEFLRKMRKQPRKFIVLAVGSGDYEREIKRDVERRGLMDSFCFLPFDPDVESIMKGCDAALMPSTWEAYPLLSSEILCCGIPLIASDCIGLREAVSDTPAVTVPARDARALAEAMVRVMSDGDISTRFKLFKHEAASRFHVRNFAGRLIDLLGNYGKSKYG